MAAAPMGDDYQKLATEQALVSEKLVVDLGISSGARVLDIGCGTGPAAIAAARRRASVVGIDTDEASLQRARLRAEAEAVDGVEFIAGDGRQLPFPDASFDVVLSTFGLVFFPDQAAAARELARVVRPGGQIALTAYTTQGIASQFFDFGHRVMQQPLPEYPHYAWSQGPRAGELLNPWFHDVRVRYEAFDTCFPSARALLDHVARWNPNMRRILASFDEPTRQRWFEGAHDILVPHNRATDGTFIADMAYAVISAVRKA